MDKLILKKQPISKSYRSVMVPMDTYEKMAQLKEESGLLLQQFIYLSCRVCNGTRGN